MVASATLSVGTASVERSGGRSGRDGASGLWSAEVHQGAISMEVALQAI